MARRNLGLLVAGLTVAGCGDRRAAPTRTDVANAGDGDRPARATDSSGPPPGTTLAATPASLDDATVIACVGDWHAGTQVLKFWGNHPDYPPDAADAYRTDRDEVIELRYEVQDGHLRLWRGDAALADVGYALSRDEGARDVPRYQLRFDAPVFGHDRYEGFVGPSFRCSPRARPTR